MTNIAITTKLGYNFKNANQISGWIYKRFDDMTAFGLFVRERGGIRATPLGKEATDPYDSAKAAEGKKKAIYKFPLLKKAAEEWNLVVPDQDAFPAKLADLSLVDWVEAKKHSDALQKLISDCFTHLRPSIEIQGSATMASGTIGAALMGSIVPLSTVDRGDMTVVEHSFGAPFGEVRTVVGTVVVKNAATLKLARSLLDVLESEIKESEASGKKATKESKSGKGGRNEPKTPDAEEKG